jgi:hypothetical protein
MLYQNPVLTASTIGVLVSFDNAEFLVLAIAKQ